MTELWSWLLITAGLDKSNDSKVELLAHQGDLFLGGMMRLFLGGIVLLKKLTMEQGVPLEIGESMSQVLGW